MIVLPDSVLRDLQVHIVQATHGLQDELGNPHITSTLNQDALRQAVIIAVQIAIGESVWPGDRAIRIRRMSRNYGIFRED